MKGVQIIVKDQKGLLSFRPGRTAAVSPLIPPPREEFLSIDNPGQATRLVAKQQLDKALDLTTSSSNHCVAAEEFKHSMTNLANWSMSLCHINWRMVLCAQK